MEVTVAELQRNWEEIATYLREECRSINSKPVFIKDDDGSEFVLMSLSHYKAMTTLLDVGRMVARESGYRRKHNN